MLTEEHRVVAFAHVSNVLGSILDAKRAAEIAHSQGRAAAARRLPGGAAPAGRRRGDRRRLLRFLRAQALRADRDRLPVGPRRAARAMPPWQGGGAMIEKVTFEETTFLDPPARFEAGTPHIVGAVGLHAAVNWVEKLVARRDPRPRMRARRRSARRAVEHPRRHALRSRGQRRNRQLQRRRGASRTTPPPYWTMRASRSAPATIARSR